MQVLETISEPMLRLGLFAAVFAVMAGLEAWRPMRRQRAGRPRRWPTNFALAVTGSVLVRLIGWIAAPLVATGAALLAARQG